MSGELTTLLSRNAVMEVVRNVGIGKFPRKGIDILKKFILYLVRKRLGLKTYELFKFVGQKVDATYYFTDDAIMKVWDGVVEKSGVSLNWLLDDECAIHRVDEVEVGK